MNAPANQGVQDGAGAWRRQHAIEPVDQQSANGGDTVIHDPDTLNALLDSVERFVRERLEPAEHVVQETDEIPEDIVAEMKELGTQPPCKENPAWGRG